MSCEIWMVSDNEELWSNNEEFKTKDEAIAFGRDYYEGEEFWVGTKSPPAQPEVYWDAADWLENVSGQEGYWGEWAEDWDGSTPKQREELEIEVRGVLSRWLDKHDLRPSFFLIRDSVKIEPEEGAS